MKRTILMISLALFLVGCEQKKIEKPEELNELSEELEVFTPKTLRRAEVDLRYVAGWLDEKQILYVDHDENEDRLRSFNIITGEVHTMFTNRAVISEVLIHPSKEQLLIKTANDSTEANIAILDKNMNVLDEITVESSELELQWNAADSTQLLISAFQEDWSYQVMHYDTNDRMVQPIEVDSPFPKWFGEEKIVYLNGNELISETIMADEKAVLAEDVVEFHSSADQLLVGTVKEERKEYMLISGNGANKHSWEAENPSEVIEDIEFIDEDNIIMSTSEVTYNGEKSEVFIHIQEGLEVQRYETDNEGGLIDCSPIGNSCLVGYGLDTILQLDTGKTVKWTE